LVEKQATNRNLALTGSDWKFESFLDPPRVTWPPVAVHIRREKSLMSRFANIAENAPKTQVELTYEKHVCRLQQ